MLIDELRYIVKKEKDVIPFLKKLSQKEKKEIVPALKELLEIVFEFRSITEKTKWGMSYSSEPTHSQKQRDIMNMACFVCFNKTDAKKSYFNNQFLANDIVVTQILPWFTPKWYGDLVNDTRPWSMTYERLMQLYKEGYFEPSRELIQARLPNSIVYSRWDKKKNFNFYKPEILEQHKATLAEHIWCLFEEESGINNFNYPQDYEGYGNIKDIWIHTIVNLVQEHKIDRKKTLIATIYTATKGFNKNLSGWFFELLLSLNPIKEEVLSLQDEFYAALNVQHSKVINTVLKYFKIIATDKKFKHTIFIENTSILLSSEVKSVVNSTLMILDKIAKTHKSSQIEVCKSASEALVHTDEKIQIRAAKIIEKYGDSNNQELCDEIEMYADNLLYASKEIISEYLRIESSEIIGEEITEVEEINVLPEHNELPIYETFDDLIFFINQAIDNNEVYHIDLLLTYLPKLHLLINGENVSKIGPILKRSFDLSFMTDEWSQPPHIELMASYYINDLGKSLLKKYPAELIDFKRHRDKKLLEDNRNFKKYASVFRIQSIPDYIYNIHRFLFIQSKSFLSEGKAFSLLSTPTHAPCWIAPETLLDRILTYEKHTIKYDLYDFQIAIGRLPLIQVSKDISEKINQIQSKEIKKVFCYHFDLVSLQDSNVLRPELWMQSILSKKNSADIIYFEETLSFSLQREMASYTWECMPRERTYKTYDYQAGRYVSQKVTEKRLDFNDFIPKKFEFKSIFTKLTELFRGKAKRKVLNKNNIYELIQFKKQRYLTTIRPKDDVKFLFLTPNNPSVYLAQVIHNNLQESTFINESSKKNMINILKGLYEIWYRDDYHEATYLFLATGFLCSEKVAREIAAEIWIKAISTATMNTVLLGETIGKLQFGEYAPLKRFTDLITDNMFNISKTHNKRLLELLDAMIGNINDTPMRGMKKMLELFLELKRSFPETSISEATIKKLTIWKTSKTLKSIVVKLV